MTIPMQRAFTRAWHGVCCLLCLAMGMVATVGHAEYPDRPINLDHIGAHIGQQHGAEGACSHGAELQHADATQGEVFSSDVGHGEVVCRRSRDPRRWDRV